MLPCLPSRCTWQWVEDSLLERYLLYLPSDCSDSSRWARKSMRCFLSHFRGTPSFLGRFEKQVPIPKLLDSGIGQELDNERIAARNQRNCRVLYRENLEDTLKSHQLYLCQAWPDLIRIQNCIQALADILSVCKSNCSLISV